jgi:fumarate reductase flavoprotein subunit
VATLGYAASPEAPGAAGRWDLIVVGGGSAGLPAAIFAAQRGARVLVIEASAVLGGTLPLSGGMLSAAGTRLQRSKGIEDTPQIHYDDIMRISGGTADPVIMRLAVFSAAPMFDWLTERGYEVSPGLPVVGTAHEPYSRARYAWRPEGGKTILKILSSELEPEVEGGRVTVLTSTEVVGLVQSSDGTARGVVTRDAAGKTSQYLARYTALTCGGYTYDPKRYQQLEGRPIYSRGTCPFHRGAGIDLGLAAGGYVRGGSNHNPMFGAVLADTDYPAPIRARVRHFPPERPPFEIFVDAEGKRFLCEDVPSHTAYEQALRALPNERCWVIFDEAMLRAAPPLATAPVGGRWTPTDTVEAFRSGTPMFYVADTLPELARAAGINAAGLSTTVLAYNAAQATGHDPLGRHHMPLPIAAAPFYAIQLQSWTLVSYAGLAVDGQLRVVRPDGVPIPNLYAAGELLGMSAFCGQSSCSGMALTPALAFGRLLGSEILSFDT